MPIEIIQECRKQIVSPRHPDGAKLCPNCQHYCLTTNEGACLCCNHQIPRIMKHEKTFKTLDKIVDNNRELIDAWREWPIKASMTPGWHLRIDARTHWVPIKWLAQYVDLPNCENPIVGDKERDRYQVFMNELITTTRLEFPQCDIVK